MVSVQKVMTKNARWLLAWVGWPIVAFALSLLAGFYVLYAFSLLVVLAQWYALRSHPASTHTECWFLVLPVFALLVYYLPLLSNAPFAVEIGILAKFYVSQCLAELWLCRMFSDWKFGRHTVANLVACFVWGLFFLALNQAASASGLPWSKDVRWIGVVFLLTTLTTNLVTGFGLLKATEK